MIMKNLLERNFISHYGLIASVTISVDVKNDENFELIDVTPVGTGTAKYCNPSHKEVSVINYESFVNSLPTVFQVGRKKCDFIVYTADFSHFLLNELTDTQPQYVSDFTRSDGTPVIGKRNKAIFQLTQTLKDIADVPDINNFIKQYITRRCCFFNTQTHAPSRIIAVIAFGRLSSIALNGYKMSNPHIESYGFEFWEFSGNQTYLLEERPSSIKSIAEQLSKLSAKEVKELTEIIESKNNNNDGDCGSSPQ